MLFPLIVVAAVLVALFPEVSYQQNFSNPVIFSDFPDNDVFLGPDGAYYFSASSFQMSPGAPILKSYDLTNWEFIGHSVPVLDFGSGYFLNGGNAYQQGIWASTMRYRQSNGLWYWIGCIGFWNTYVFTAPEVTGPWKMAGELPGGTCYYDCGLLIDDDDTMYVAYGNTNVSMAQLSSDGLSQTKSQYIFSGPTSMQGLEGNRLYKINGTYYILDDSPQGVTFIWRSSSVWGPWTSQILQNSIGSPLPGGGLIDQGSLVQAPNRQWYFMSTSWDFPSGRIPVLAPIEWNDGWPSLVEVNGAWGASYPYPASPDPLYSFTGTDTFNSTELSAQWEWNFNPDTTKFRLTPGNLTLYTATVTDDVFSANNTLTHRTYGTTPEGTAQLNIANMADGDRAGLAAFRDQSAWVEIFHSGSQNAVRMISNATQDANNNWATVSTGVVEAAINLPSAVTQVWLRTTMNTMPNSNRDAMFSYSIDGESFISIGTSFTMSNTLNWFTGYRFGIFNFATKALGGYVSLVAFENH